MTLATIQSLIDFLVFFIAYAVSVTIAGSFQATVTNWLGDDTAEDAGMTSLSPLMHVDPIGLVCLYAFGIGWGQPVPIDHRNIYGTAKLLFAYLAHVVMYIIIGIVALFTLVAVFGVGPLQSVQTIAQLQASYPQYASVVMVIMRMLLGLVGVNAWLGAIGLIRRGFQATLVIFFPDVLENPEMQYVVMFGPLMIMILFLGTFTSIISTIIMYGGFGFAALLKLL